MIRINTRAPILALAAALALGLGALPAVAQTPAKPTSCPPGLAAKQNGCQPPGLEKKGSNDYERVWRKGDRIGGFAFHIIVQYARYGLPKPPSGQFYVALGDQVLLVREDTLSVLSLVGMVNKILG